MPRRPPKIEGWFSELADGRIEVFLRANGHKLRASGPEPFVSALVEVWEERTGLEARHQEWKRSPRRGTRPIAGQLDMMSGVAPNDSPENELVGSET